MFKPVSWLKATLFFLCLQSVNLQAESLASIYQNKKIRDLQETDLVRAMELLQEQIGKEPDSTLSKFNLAGLYLSNKDADSALAIYSEIEEALSAKESLSEEEKEFLYVSRFAKASIFGVKKEISKAIDLYGKALEVFPQDKAAKINIEILVQSSQSQDGKGDGEDQESDPQDQEGKKPKDGKDSKNKDQRDEQKDKQEKPEDQKDQEKKDDKQEGKEQRQKPKPKKQEFKENELSKQDVKQIFEELKRQEEKIRAKQFEGTAKERQLEKDW